MYPIFDIVEANVKIIVPKFINLNVNVVLFNKSRHIGTIMK